MRTPGSVLSTFETGMAAKDVSGDGGVMVTTKKRGNGVFPQPGQVVFGECCWTCIAVSRMFVCCAVTGLALIMLTLPLSALHGRSRHGPGV